MRWLKWSLALAAFLALSVYSCARWVLHSCADGDAVCWRMRLGVALARKNDADAVLSLTKVARARPAALNRLSLPALGLTLLAAGRASKGERLGLLEALYDGHLKLFGHFEPSDQWRDLTLLLLDAGRTAKAKEVASRVTAPDALIGMRADARFSPVMPAGFGPTEVRRAALREIEDMREYSRANPRSLMAVARLAKAMVKAREYREALALADDAARKAGERAGGAPYDDPGVLNWLLDVRARALKGLGRWDDAVAQLEAAARKPESGKVNVSERINLAAIFLDVGRPKEALAAIGETGPLSPYGRMQIASVRHEAALQLKDAAMADAAMRDLRAHRADAPLTWEEELLYAGETDEAAAAVIARVNDPERRTQALTELQTYEAPPAPAPVMEFRARRRALLARADVKAAIAKVGRIDRYDLEPLP